MGKKKTHEQFMEQLLDKRQDFLDEYEIMSRYVGADSKIEVLHKKCNKIWMVTPNKLLQNRRCGHCYSSKKRTHEEFTHEVNKQAGNEYSVLGEYVNSQTKVSMKHNVCGHVWDVIPNKFIGREQTRCPKCSHNSIKSYFETVKICKDLNIKLITKESEYTTTNSKLTFECECGNIFKRKLGNVKKSKTGNLCNKCSLKIKSQNHSKDYLQFERDFYGIFPKEEYALLTKYNRSRERVEVKHLTCGNIFTVIPVYIKYMRINGCPICTSSSSYERTAYGALLKMFKKENIHREYTFSDLRGKKFPLRFDFCIKKENKIFALIEIDGQYHYVNEREDGGLDKQKKQ